MDWLSLLRQEVARANNNKTEVARRIGVSRTAVSLALADRYPSDTAKLAAKVLAALSNRLACFHCEAGIAPSACADRSTRPMPTSSPAELRAWTICQACSNRPTGGNDAE